MKLSARERHALRAIEKDLQARDRGLAEFLRTFGQEPTGSAGICSATDSPVDDDGQLGRRLRPRDVSKSPRLWPVRITGQVRRAIGVAAVVMVIITLVALAVVETQTVTTRCRVRPSRPAATGPAVPSHPATFLCSERAGAG